MELFYYSDQNLLAYTNLVSIKMPILEQQYFPVIPEMKQVLYIFSEHLLFKWLQLHMYTSGI